MCNYLIIVITNSTLNAHRFKRSLPLSRTRGDGHVSGDNELGTECAAEIFKKLLRRLTRYNPTFFHVVHERNFV